MSQHAATPFRFNEDDVTLREEIPQTEKQRLSVRHFFETDRTKTHIDVLPRTIFVPRELAESNFGVKRSLFLSGVYPENIHVYGAPEFLYCKSANSKVKSSYAPFVNIDKDDLRAITVFENSCPIPTDTPTCLECHFDKKDRRLFALACGHWLCRTCWRIHCLGMISKEICPIPCPNGYCKEKLTVSRAAALLSDAAIKIMLAVEWRNKLLLKDTLRCAGCKRWMQRSNIYSKASSAACACGCYTCIGCGQLDHTPLTCKDASVWTEIRSKENEEESAAAAQTVWALTFEDFEECLLPSQAIACDEFKKNLRFMKTNDRANGELLEKTISMVARMLEMRHVQQLANRKGMQARSDDVHGDECNLRWSNLETHFDLALDTIGETRIKAEYLDNYRRHVLRYYE